MNLGLLLLRSAVGLTLAAHGSQKLFGWFGGYGLAGTGAFMESLGFVPGRRAALGAGLAELLGGLFLALGLLTPVGAALAIAVMLVAVATVHLEKGFFVTGGGFEYNFILSAAALALAFTGAGAYSLDAALGIGRAGVGWGLGALVAALAGGGIQLAARRRPEATAQHS